MVYLALEWLLNLTAAGKLIRAIAADPWMAQLLGVNVGLVYSATVALGFALAGLAGGFLVANQSLSPDLAGIFIIQAFGVVIIGGMGSIRGAFLASLLLASSTASEPPSCPTCRASCSSSPSRSSSSSGRRASSARGGWHDAHTAPPLRPSC